MCDSKLVQQAQAGDRDAFGGLVSRYRGLVYGLCYGMAGGASDAEDLAHDAFVEAYLKLHRLRDPERFGAWLRTLTLNLCRMWHRRRKRERDSIVDLQPDPASDGDGLREKVAGALTRLSGPHRLALVLHYWEGLSYGEIAALLNVPPGTVMSRLHRARGALKREIDRMSEQEEIPMVPDDEFSRAVEAEIEVLMKGFDEASRERLRVILEHSPERFGQVVIERMEDASAADDLALLLKRLGGPAIDAVLAYTFFPDAELRAKALAVLGRLIGKGRGRPRTGIHWQLPLRAETTLLLDRLIRTPEDARAKAELLMELTGACEDKATGNLVVSVLLCYADEAFPLLLERFQEASGPEDLHRPPWVLAALRRTGTRFCEALLQALGDDDTHGLCLALAGVEAVAKSLDRERLDGASPEKWDLEARSRGTLFPEQMDRAVLRSATEKLAGLIAHPHRGIRDTAIRVLGKMSAVHRRWDAADTSVRACREGIAGCLRHDALSTRLAAIRALSDIGEGVDVEALLERAEKGEPAERRAAAEALGHLRAAEARGLLTDLIEDSDSGVRRAAVIALGELEDEEAATTLRGLIGSADKKLARAAASALYGGRKRGRQASETTVERLKKVRGDARPPLHISPVAAIRALPEIRPYEERELTRLIAAVCGDYSTTRRHLVMGMGDRIVLMVRDHGTYELTELGKAVWRVERFIRENYLK